MCTALIWGRFGHLEVRFAVCRDTVANILSAACKWFQCESHDVNPNGNLVDVLHNNLGHDITRNIILDTTMSRK